MLIGLLLALLAAKAVSSSKLEGAGSVQLGAPPPPPVAGDVPTPASSSSPSATGEVPKPPSSPAGVIAGAAAGAGVGAVVAQLTDSNVVSSGVAVGGGAIAGGAVALVGAVAAAPVVIAAAAAFGVTRLGQDLFELSTGRQEMFDKYRAQLADAYASGGQAAKDALHAQIVAENVARYVTLMKAPRISPFETDQARLTYLVDRGRLLSDASGVNGYANLEFEGYLYDWKAADPLKPIRSPLTSTNPSPEAVRRVAATRLGQPEPV